MVKIILIKPPDEWATTKQACRDELLVYLSIVSRGSPQLTMICLSPPTIYTSLYSYVLSTVLRKSKFYSICIYKFIYRGFI